MDQNNEVLIPRTGRVLLSSRGYQLSELQTFTRTTNRAMGLNAVRAKRRDEVTMGGNGGGGGGEEEDDDAAAAAAAVLAAACWVAPGTLPAAAGRVKMVFIPSAPRGGVATIGRLWSAERGGRRK